MKKLSKTNLIEKTLKKLANPKKKMTLKDIKVLSYMFSTKNNKCGK